MGGQIGQSLFVLLALIGVAWAGLYFAKKYMPRFVAGNSTGKRLQMLEVMRLTPRTTLYVVRFDDKTFLLAQSGETVNVLETKPIPPLTSSE